MLTPAPQEQEAEQPESFADVVALFQKHREVMLYSHLFNDVRLVSFQVGRIEVIPTEHIPADFAARFGRKMTEWCDKTWRISYADDSVNSEPSLREQAQLARQQRIDYATAHPNIQKIMELFEGTELLDVEPINNEETP